VSPVVPSEISPADVVSLRFPPDWAGEQTTGAAPAAFALASAEQPRQIDAGFLFSPRETFPTRLASASPIVPWPNVAPQASAQPSPPVRAEPKPEPKPEAGAAVASAQPAAAPVRRPPPQAQPQPHKDSGTLFNDAQLASIKSRLKLSEYQEQYWPPVATALRAIGWRASHEPVRKGAHAGATRLAEIDPASAEVQQLKSAAFPLIMSMNDDQKREVRMLAHVMGLEQVAASF
jgi:hypothetical protein